jgi:hypothetical protein
MSSLALPREAAPRRARSASVRTLIAQHGYEIALAAPIALLAAVLLIELPGAFSVDSWLELVTGRLIWASGVPHHETLTLLAHGAPWIDQQWLSQLASYGLYALGGLGLLGLVNVALLTGGVAFATFAGRRFGAPFVSTVIALPLGLIMIAPAREVRTQTFVVPLFALLVYLLARDSRRPSARVYWCLPLLVVWANLHGTVTMAAGLVALHGVVILFERRRMVFHSLRAWRRPVALIAGSAVAITATPYGLSIINYYRTTMVSSTLRHAVSEWQPVTSSPLTAAALAIVAVLAVVSFIRRPARTTLWEKLAFVILAVGAASVVRNALFLGLFALMVLPVSLGWGRTVGARAKVANRGVLISGLLASLATVALLTTLAATLTRPAAGLEYGFVRPGVVNAVARVTRTDPSLRVMADQKFTDWLLWRDPALAGRMAFDVRFELYSGSQLTSLEALFNRTGAHWKTAARGYRVLALNRADDPRIFTYFKHEPDARVLYNDGQRVVILRGAAEAAR